MKNYVEILKKSKLFENIEDSEINSMINCLSIREREYKKGDFVLRIGDSINTVNMVTEGGVHILKEDYWGNQSIVAEIGVGELFGETYACLKDVPLQVNAAAIKNSNIIEIDVDNILSGCSSMCKFHSRLIKNLLSVVAEKNLILTNKLECMAQRNTRDKIMSYLSLQSQKNKSSEFDIPFNRQQFADYLAVDRSAMSRELSRLRDEGVLCFNKSHFKLN